MINKHKKIWAHYERLRLILGLYITLFFAVPILSLCFSYLIHSKEIDSGVQDAVKMALLSGFKCYAIIMSVVTVLFVIWGLFYSATVEFTDSTIKYYSWIFSKKSRNIPYKDITDVVFSDGLWQHRGKYEHGRKIRIFNKNNLILMLDLYYKLCIVIILELNEKKIWLVGENRHLNSIDNYFKINYNALSYEQQKILLKFYCKFSRNKYKTGEEILKKNYT